jgi:rhamnosyltransferase
MVIVDNNSPPELLAGVPKRDTIHVMELGDNKGVAEAQNIGILEAEARGATHVLLLDQDSHPSENMVARLFAALVAIEASGKHVGAVGPQWTNAVSGQTSSFSPRAGLKKLAGWSDLDQDWVECDSLISAGSLIPIEAIRSVGLMDVGLFIDHVDTEWCLRAHAKGYRVFGVRDARLSQALGEIRNRIWLFGWRDVVSHKPFRYYYMFRNSVLLNRRDYVRREWKRWNRVVLLILLGLHGVLIGPRLKNISMMWRGTVDGFRGVTGSIEVPHAG